MVLCTCGLEVDVQSYVGHNSFVGEQLLTPANGGGEIREFDETDWKFCCGKRISGKELSVCPRSAQVG